MTLAASPARPLAEKPGLSQRHCRKGGGTSSRRHLRGRIHSGRMSGHFPATPKRHSAEGGRGGNLFPPHLSIPYMLEHEDSHLDDLREALPRARAS
jgi:hypothetical protein